MVLLPWLDDRCDGLPQKRLLIACMGVLLLAEVPMLFIKGAHVLDSHTTGLAAGRKRRARPLGRPPEALGPLTLGSPAQGRHPL